MGFDSIDSAALGQGSSRRGAAGERHTLALRCPACRELDHRGAQQCSCGPKSHIVRARVPIKPIAPIVQPSRAAPRRPEASFQRSTSSAIRVLDRRCQGSGQYGLRTIPTSTWQKRVRLSRRAPLLFLFLNSNQQQRPNPLYVGSSDCWPQRPQRTCHNGGRAPATTVAGRGWP